MARSPCLRASCWWAWCRALPWPSSARRAIWTNGTILPDSGTARVVHSTGPRPSRPASMASSAASTCTWSWVGAGASRHPSRPRHPACQPVRPWRLRPVPWPPARAGYISPSRRLLALCRTRCMRSSSTQPPLACGSAQPTPIRAARHSRRARRGLPLPIPRTSASERTLTLSGPSSSGISPRSPRASARR